MARNPNPLGKFHFSNKPEYIEVVQVNWIVLSTPRTGSTFISELAFLYLKRKQGYQANLLLVDGNPLKDISVTERISMVMFKGERVDRSELFDQK